jgi:hypothetical protein
VLTLQLPASWLQPTVPLRKTARADPQVELFGCVFGSAGCKVCSSEKGWNDRLLRNAGGNCMDRLDWLIVALALLEGSWLAFDAAHALITGDYVTPKTGRVRRAAWANFRRTHRGRLWT